MATKSIKLSSAETKEFWEIPVLFEDEHLLAIDKPARLLLSPAALEPTKPSLIALLHRDIERGAPWAVSRGLSFLSLTHKLDFETSGVLILAKSKPVQATVSESFGNEKPIRTFAALIAGVLSEETVEVKAKLSPHPIKEEFMRVDEREGRRAITIFRSRERFFGYSLVEAQPMTGVPYQIRAHLKYLKTPIVGDTLYGGGHLLLSRLKDVYRLKPGATERPLIADVALHAETVALAHPVTGAPLTITAPLPKDFNVALKMLRRHAAAV